jgi:8-amino-7-oxononanoate synthase
MTRRHDQALATVDEVRLAMQPPGATPTRTAAESGSRPSELAFDRLPEYEDLKIKRAVGELAGLTNPFHRLHEGRASDTTVINGKTVVNFSSYDYLGLNGDPRVRSAAKQAIDTYGTSVSASRLSGGERPIHLQLEAALARLHECEDALAFVSGHATNVSVIGTLLGPKDLIVCDAVIHNSVMEGARLSGARRIFVPHGDLEAMERALRLNRARHARVLVVVEGLYSMDGDMPDLAALVALKRRYDAWLMVDEAHSTGVLGRTGKGVAEEQATPASGVDIWMGTLSKTLSSAGGYIAGSTALIEILKYKTPGFVYSVGLPAPVAAAALAALEIMAAEPLRIERLRKNGRRFLEGARARGLDVGTSIGAAITPVIVGNSPDAVVLAERLLGRGFNLVPAVFPGVAENQARLRFFLTSEHQPDQIDAALEATAQELEAIRKGPSFVSRIAG